MNLSRKKLINTIAGIVAASALTCIVAPTFAQDSEEGVFALEEVVVTARKREESIMDIPVSVGVITSEMMHSANIVDIGDLAAKTPGLKFNSAFGRQADRPVIRGISSIFTTEELVGYFIDGVYVVGSIQSLDLSAVERVEVIKGPQSATFGRRTFAGAINYVTAQPTEELEITAKATGGSNGLVDVSASLGGKPSDVFAYRLNVRSYNYDGDFKNTKPDGPAVGGQETNSANLGLFFYPTDNLTMQVNLNYSKDEDEQYAITMFPRADLDVCLTDVTLAYHCGTVLATQPISLGGIMPNKDYGTDRTRKRSFFKLDYDFDWALFSWTSSYNKVDYSSGMDQTFMGLETVFSFVTYGQEPATGWHTLEKGDSKDQSHEAWMRGTTANDKLDWGVGAYYFKEDGDSVLLNGDGSLNSTSVRDVKNTAFMALLEYKITDAFNVSGEIRRASDDVSENQYNNTWKSTTYRAIGSWNYSDKGMAYLSYSTGVLPGGFNTNPGLPANLVNIDEQGMNSLELGWKATISDQLVVTAAIFDMEWTDQVRSEFYPNTETGLPVGYSANQGTSDIRGFEFSTDWYPVERLHFEVAGSFSNTKIKDFVSTDATDIQWSANKDGDVSGNKIPLSPETELYFAGDYTIPVGNSLSLTARMDYSYQSKRYVRTINWADTGDEGLLGAQLTLAGENWSAMLWGKNLTDEDSATSALRYFEANSFFFSGRSFAATPRPGAEYGVTVRYRF